MVHSRSLLHLKSCAPHADQDPWLKAFAPEVSVNCVAPGMIVNGEVEPAYEHFANKTPMGHSNGKGEDVAAAVTVLCDCSPPLHHRADSQCGRRPLGLSRPITSSSATVSGSLSKARILVLMDYEITVEELKAQLASSKPPLILDVREPWEHQAARITGSKLIPMGDLPSRSNSGASTKSREIHPVLCHHGVRSLKVTIWLRQQGFENARSVAGGIDRWSRTIDPSIPIY